MRIISITENDIRKMVNKAVKTILKESISEVQGSAMAEKEDAVDEVVEWIKERWENVLEKNELPMQDNTFDMGDGEEVRARVYQFEPLPFALTETLGIAEELAIVPKITNFTISEGAKKNLGYGDKATVGMTLNSDGKTFGEFSKTKLLLKRGYIELGIPAINDEIQIPGLYNTLFHELNHAATNRAIKAKASKYIDDKTGKVKSSKSGEEMDIEDVALDSFSRRKENNPHHVTQAELHPDEIRAQLQANAFGDHLEAQRAITYLFYGLWETTERNARVEGIYADLKVHHANRENFKQVLKQTEFYRQVQEFKDLVDIARNVQDTNEAIWTYVAYVMGMNPRNSRAVSYGNGKGKSSIIGEDEFLKKVKKRFIKRSEELIGLMFKKGMKVAELYLQRQEDKQKSQK